MTDLKGSNYWKICGDVFTFLKESLPVQDKEEYWEKIIQAAGEIYKKYEQTPEKDFAKDQILSVVTELEHICQRKEGEAS